jgi:uncharacterized OB-fold protein
MTASYDKPLPDLYNPAISGPFWEAAKRHELILPRCKTCSEVFFYPREVCPTCLSAALDWTPASGKGRVYSYTVVHQPAHPAFREDAPYFYAMIQLDEGPRMIGNLIDCALDEVEIDMPVTAVFDDVTPEVTLIRFKPA